MLCKIFISTLIDLWILYIMNWSELVIDTIYLSLPFQYSYMKVLVKKNQCSLPWARHIICTINPKLNSHLVYRSLFVYMFIFHLLGFNFFFATCFVSNTIQFFSNNKESQCSHFHGNLPGALCPPFPSQCDGSLSQLFIWYLDFHSPYSHFDTLFTDSHVLA